MLGRMTQRTIAHRVNGAGDSPCPARPSATSPFETRNRLLGLARGAAARPGGRLLDAGRGNPDWIAVEPRRAFFQLGRHAALGNGLPDQGAQLDAFVRALGYEDDGEPWWSRALAWAESSLDLDRHALFGGLCDGVLGARYPEPPAMLPLPDRICRAHLAQVYGLDERTAQSMRLFATEGASAAICYLFESLLGNGLLAAGDRIAVVTPIFSPYLEILSRPAFGFGIDVLPLDEGGGWQLPQHCIDRLRDPAIRALVAVNPGNPVACPLGADVVERIGTLVESERPDLLVISDDDYGPLVPGYASFAARLPRNTAALFSYSKFFGATGWRLGIMSLAADHVLDRWLAERPDTRIVTDESRYGSLSAAPGGPDFFHRLVADSRGVAFHHTAGLSTPQQVQMALFALDALMDAEGRRCHELRAALTGRRAALWRGLGLPAPFVQDHTGYYEWLDTARLVRQWAPLASSPAALPPAMPDLLDRLAAGHGVVVLPGSGFGGSDSSLRVSLANLPEADLERVGRALRAVCTDSGEA